MEPELAAAYAPYFYDFIADGLRSPNHVIVNAVLSMFDRPEGIQVIVRDAEIALPRICGPLAEVRDRHWFVKLREKAATVFKSTALADRGFFEGGCQSDRQSGDCFEKWQLVIEKAGQVETISVAELMAQAKRICTASAIPGFHRLSKPFPPECPEGTPMTGRSSRWPIQHRKSIDVAPVVMTPILALRRRSLSSGEY
jgi:hypothetical protein